MGLKNFKNEEGLIETSNNVSTTIDKLHDAIKCLSNISLRNLKYKKDKEFLKDKQNELDNIFSKLIQFRRKRIY